MGMESSKKIKPCSVQIKDLRSTLKTQLLDSLELTDHDRPSTSSGVKWENQRPGDGQGGSSEMGAYGLVVSEDGWIKVEPPSPQNPQAQSGQETSKMQADMSDDTEYDSDLELQETLDDNSGDDEINPDDGDSDSHSENCAEGATSKDYKDMVIDLDGPVPTETLREIMKVVYKVKDPTYDTLIMLNEQMEERRNLKYKLLRDLQLGKSMFEKRHRRKTSHARIVEKEHGEVNLSHVTWTPHQPLTLARATAHIAAQHQCQTRVTAHQNQTRASTSGEGPTVQTRDSPLHHHPMKPTVPNPPAAEPVIESSSSTPAPPPPPLSPKSGDIKFLDTSSLPMRAVFLPKSRTVSIQEMKPGPPGCQDVLVPVDASGHMKEPFMGIPLNTCNIQFAPSNEDPTNKEPEQTGRSSSQSQGDHPPHPVSTTPLSTSTPDRYKDHKSDAQSPAFSQANAAQQRSLHQGQGPQPGVGVFLHPQPPFAAVAPGGPKPPGPFLPPRLPPGLMPSGTLPPQYMPSGVSSMGPIHPGALPPGMLAVPYRPGFQIPPGYVPHGVMHANGVPLRCTCPPGTRPPAPPPHTATLPLPEDQGSRTETQGLTSRESNATPNGPSMDNQSSMGRPLSSSNPDKSDNHNKSDLNSDGITIKNVYSCGAAVGPRGQPASQGKPKPDTQQGTPPKTSNHPGALLTVILPSNVKEHYQHLLNQGSDTGPLANDLKEIQKPATKMDLGLVWNEISILRNEMQYVKTNIALELKDMREGMENFKRLVGERMGIPMSRWTMTGVGESEEERKRKQVESADSEQSTSKRARLSKT